MLKLKFRTWGQAQRAARALTLLVDLRCLPTNLRVITSTRFPREVWLTTDKEDA